MRWYLIYRETFVVRRGKVEVVSGVCVDAVLAKAIEDAFHMACKRNGVKMAELLNPVPLASMTTKAKREAQAIHEARTAEINELKQLLGVMA